MAEGNHLGLWGVHTSTAERIPLSHLGFTQRCNRDKTRNQHNSATETRKEIIRCLFVLSQNLNTQKYQICVV
jgi:hypothetical protein